MAKSVKSSKSINSIKSTRVDSLLRWLLLLLLVLWIVPLLYIYSWGGQKITLPDSNLTAKREEESLRARLAQLKESSVGAADIAAVHLALANHLSRYSFYADAEREYMNYLDQKKKLHADDHARLQDYLIVSSGLRDVGKFPEAEALLLKALACTEAGDGITRAKIYNSLGLIHYLWGQSGRTQKERERFFAQSDAYYREAIDALKLAPLAGAVDCADGKGSIQCALKNNYADLLREYAPPTASR